MIALKELIDLEVFKTVPSDHVCNLMALHHKMNQLRARYGRPMIVTSGYRSAEKHAEIYEKVNAKRKAEGLEPVTPPMGSQHLIGAACDIWDPKAELKDWVSKNLDFVEKLDLYMEVFEATPRHLHLQLYSPKSGNRFFKP